MTCNMFTCNSCLKRLYWLCRLAPAICFRWQNDKKNTLRKNKRLHLSLSLSWMYEKKCTRWKGEETSSTPHIERKELLIFCGNLLYTMSRFMWWKNVIQEIGFIRTIDLSLGPHSKTTLGSVFFSCQYQKRTGSRFWNLNDNSSRPWLISVREWKEFQIFFF